MLQSACSVLSYTDITLTWYVIPIEFYNCECNPNLCIASCPTNIHGWFGDGARRSKSRASKEIGRRLGPSGPLIDYSLVEDTVQSTKIQFSRIRFDFSFVTDVHHLHKHHFWHGGTRRITAASSFNLDHKVMNSGLVTNGVLTLTKVNIPNAICI